MSSLLLSDNKLYKSKYKCCLYNLNLIDTNEHDFIFVMNVLKSLGEDFYSFGDLYMSIAKDYYDFYYYVNKRELKTTTYVKLKNIINQNDEINPFINKFDLQAIDNESLIRTIPVSFLYPYKENKYDLIKVSIEITRITHHNSLSFLSSTLCSLFCSYAIRNEDPLIWIFNFINNIDDISKYIIETNKDPDENLTLIECFRTSWVEYMLQRNIKDNEIPLFENEYIQLKNYNVNLAVDCMIIVYDVFLYTFVKQKKIRESHKIINTYNSSVASNIFICIYSLYYFEYIEETNKNKNLIKDILKPIFDKIIQDDLI
jgi:hypothetical protein